MFEYLKGKITYQSENYFVLEVGNIGYKIFYSPQDDFDFSQDTTKVYVYESIREDSWDLYGFSSIYGRKLFEKLLSIPKVGPKLALTIVSTYSFRELVGYIKEGDVAALNRVSGIGKKTAERIILELQDKVTDLFISLGGEEEKTAKSLEVSQPEWIEDIRLALLNLGFSSGEIKRKLKELEEKNPQLFEKEDLDTILSEVLASFYKENR